MTGGDLARIDVGAYVAPGIELIYERGPGEFRGQWEALQRYLTVAAPQPGLGDRASAHLSLAVDGRRPGSTIWDGALTASPAGPVEPGILHDNAAGRLRAMDRLGIDVQLLSPGPTLAATRWLPSNIAAGVLGAYNQFALGYCAHDPGRLKVVLQLHGGEPEWSAAELRELASEPAVAAATLWLPARFSPDDRRFAPIWTVLQETGVPLLHRPGACSAVWTPRRLLAYLAFTRILDRHPTIRVAFGETGVGWVPGWPDQVSQAVAGSRGGGADVRSYIEQRRIFVALGRDDDELTIRRAVAELGGDSLLWQSHFPYWPLERLEPTAERVGFARNAASYVKRDEGEHPPPNAELGVREDWPIRH
jgi:predicted TIM-barrel fold metal-dependent hydrolase